MANQEIGLFEAIYSQRAIRSYTTEPVSEETLRRIIEAGTKAPSGGNRQPWAFVAVTDSGAIATIATHAKAQFAPMYDRAVANLKPGDEPPFPRLKPLVDKFETVTAVIFPCLVQPEGSTDPPSTGASSIFPAVQNMLLAARGLGVGAVLTTLALRDPGPVKELLGLPENVHPLALIPLGYPDKERYGKTTRKPLSEVAHWNRWGNLDGGG
ncbi:MAG: nitroreductase family protein [Chloroflexota bacterium]|nr:nitroreductase family protein [Chloroflexota bacterium]